MIRPIVFVLCFFCATLPIGSQLLDPHTQIPEFSYYTSSGIEVNRDSLKGKIWLIEFWASWCIPCRRQHPDLNSLLTKLEKEDENLHNRFGVLGISFDKDTSAWRKAIFNDKLKWQYQVCDTLSWDGPSSKKFKLWHIPYNFIVDDKGIIKGQELYGSGLEEKLRILLKL